MGLGFNHQHQKFLKVSLSLEFQPTCLPKLLYYQLNINLGQFCLSIPLLSLNIASFFPLKVMKLSTSFPQPLFKAPFEARFLGWVPHAWWTCFSLLFSWPTSVALVSNLFPKKALVGVTHLVLTLLAFFLLHCALSIEKSIVHFVSIKVRYFTFILPLWACPSSKSMESLSSEHWILGF